MCVCAREDVCIYMYVIVLVFGGIDTDLYCLEVVTCLQIRVETLKVVWIVKSEKFEKHADGNHNDTHNRNTILELHNYYAMFYLQF